MLEDGDIHWTVISAFGDEDRWITEGVQIGGIQSSRGFMGVRSDSVW